MASRSILIMLAIIGSIMTNERINPSSEDWSSTEEADVCPITEEAKNMGAYFPVKYLAPDETIPTSEDLEYYLSSMMRTVLYFHKDPNSTNCNTAVGLYLMKCVLKRTINDDARNLKKHHIDVMKDVINKADYIISHYVYINHDYGWTDAEFRVSMLFIYDEPFIFSIGDFNRNRLRKLILTESHINKYVEEMDQATLPKENYVALVDDMTTFNINIDASDICITRVVYNREPMDLSKTEPCFPDAFCKHHIHASPSVAYTLSHRLLNVLSLRYFRRCYIVSDEDDAMLMDVLCSFMYREAVYLARRGYFARDIFMEHLALCGLLGYEELFRRHWFHKVASWIDERGCIQEFLNFQVNRTKILNTSNKSTPKNELKKDSNLISEYLKTTCHEHPMAVSLAFLANGIRHAAHFMTL